MKRLDTTLRESIGLILLVLGIALVPMGWLGGGGVLSVAVLMISVGIWMFYTQRMRLRDMAAKQAEAEAEAAAAAEAEAEAEASDTLAGVDTATDRNGK